MATDIREWEEILDFPKEGWLNGLLKRKDQYQVLFKERDTEDGIRYYIAWVNLPGKRKDNYDHEAARCGQMVGTDTYGLDILDTPENDIRSNITAIIEEHIQYQKEAK